MRVTLKDVASLAGVSEGTASRALADSLRVNPATRKRIKAISKKVGYRPNIRARALATGKLLTVGAVVATECPEKIGRTLGAAHLLEPIHDELALRDLHLLLSLEPVFAPLDTARFELPKMIAERHTDGLLVLSYMSEALAEALGRFDLPFVVVNARQVNDVCTINVKEEHTTAELVHYLADLGHRQIALVNGNSENAFRSRLRPLGYAYAMEEEGLPPYPGYENIEHMTAAFDRLWSNAPPPTAVITYDDLAAAGLMRFLRNRGLRVPEDVSVASAHAHHHFGEWLPTRLTRMHRPNAEMARAATEAVIALMKGNPRQAKSVSFEPELEIGETTGPPKQ